MPFWSTCGGTELKSNSGSGVPGRSIAVPGRLEELGRPERGRPDFGRAPDDAILVLRRASTTWSQYSAGGRHFDYESFPGMTTFF